MNYWLVKQEPEEFSWSDCLAAGEALWDGVRNYQARNNLKAMRLGDQVLFYHSVTDKKIVGLMEVNQEAFPDPTDPQWIAVRFRPLRSLAQPVGLEVVKADPLLAELPLVKQSRLSVMPIPAAAFERILELSGGLE
jgi:predicted RNA-binding protein with PUA-like domain